MPYPYTIGNETGLYDVFVDTNAALNGMPGIFILLLIWFVGFISLQTYFGASKAIMASSFGCAMIATFMFIGEFISYNTWITMAVIFMISAFVSYIMSDGN